MDALRRNAWLSVGSLFASVATLICCVLPAVLVALGAGAAVVGLVAAIPQLVWLSERKGMVFGLAGAILATSATALWRARHLPCPADPGAAAACRRLRRFSVVLLTTSALLVAAGVLVSFVLPAMAT
jgi:hypothetical protein